MPDYYNTMGAEFGAEFAGVGPQLDGVMAGIPIGTPIPIGGTLTANVNLTKHFRADRLILDAVTRAAGVYVQQISINSEEQVISPNPVPAEVFTPDATHRLRGTIAAPGVGINITFLNTTAGAVTPGGAFFGPAKKPGEAA